MIMQTKDYRKVPLTRPIAISAGKSDVTNLEKLQESIRRRVPFRSGFCCDNPVHASVSASSHAAGRFRPNNVASNSKVVLTRLGKWESSDSIHTNKKEAQVDGK